MNRDALVVGINQYPVLKDNPTSKAKHLSTPASDAEAIALRLEEYGGFRARQLPETVQQGQPKVAQLLSYRADRLVKIIPLRMPLSNYLKQVGEFRSA